jgi:hypothetical protein
MTGVVEILDAMKDKMDDHELAQKISLVTYDTVDNYLLSKVFPLLARRGKDWLAYVLGMNHPLFEKIISITEKKTWIFCSVTGKREGIILPHPSL